MPKKRASTIPPKLTEAEQALLAHIEHGYQLETDSPGGNPVLRSPKSNEVLRPANTKCQYRESSGKPRPHPSWQRTRSAHDRMAFELSGSSAEKGKAPMNNHITKWLNDIPV